MSFNCSYCNCRHDKHRKLYISTNEALDACLKLIDGNGGTFPDLLDTENANTDTFGNTADESTNKGTPTLKEPPSGRTDVQPPENMNL